MSKEKTAFPYVDGYDGGHGITYRQYLAARVYPEMIKRFYDPTDKQSKFTRAAELTWQAVDVLIKAEEANNDKDSD